MLRLALVPVFLVWVVLAGVVALGLAATLGWCLWHVLGDILWPSRGRIWCPVLERSMRVYGVPRHSSVGVQFSSLARCERWGPYPVRCAKKCLTA